MNFLIQTLNGKIKHDFSFTLIEAIKYQNWYYQNKDCQYILTSSKKPFVPVGSVEFVCYYLEQYYNIYPLPKNIPETLIPFANRIVFNDTQKGLINTCFVKSNDKIKSFAQIVSNDETLKPGNYQFSELIDIDSEWRCFIYQNKLVGLQNYSGSFILFPDIIKIQQMINAYVNAPIAYTLDIGINNKGTFIIEVHDFFSCGLYGFSDLRILPDMFNQWFLNII